MITSVYPQRLRVAWWMPVLSAWFVTILWLTLAGVFDTTIADLPVAIILAIGLPLAGFALAYRFMTDFQNWIHQMDIKPIILLHTWRMLGFGFVMLAVYDRLSPIFAYPAGIGDALSAVGALILGLALYQGNHVRPGHIYAWSLFGLLDFVLAIALGVLTRPGMEVFDRALTSQPMGEFPLALIPGFVVTFYLLSHFVIWINARSHRIHPPVT